LIPTVVTALWTCGWWGQRDLHLPGTSAPWLSAGPNCSVPLNEKARDIGRRADAQGDEDHIAMALALQAPVWTLDKDFVRAKGVGVLRTRDVDWS
jgi:PIN domain